MGVVAKMKKYILFGILAIVVGITLGFPYIKTYYTKSVSEYISEQRLVGIGNRVSEDFLISDKSGNKLGLTTAFPNGVLLMIYDKECPACRKAVAYMEVSLAVKTYSRSFAVLEFSKKIDPDLKDLKYVNAFAATIDQDETVFRGRVSPLFFLIDAEGIIQDKQIGWSEVLVEELLQKDLNITQMMSENG